MPRKKKKKTSISSRKKTKNKPIGKLKKNDPASSFTKDRYERLIEWYNSSLKDSKNKIIGTVSFGKDITESKKAQIQLNSIFDMVVEMICIADLNKAKFIRVNSAFSRVLGYSQKELLSKSFMEFVHPEDIKATREVIEKNLKMGKKVISFTNRYKTKKGHYRYLEWNSQPKIEEGLIYAIAHDITEKREIHNRLEESESRLSFHLENTPVAAIEWDLDFRVVSWNRAAEDIFGFKREEVMGKYPWQKILPKNAKEKIDMIWQSLLKQKGGERSVNKNLTKDGRIIICEWNNTPLLDKKGKVVGVASLVQDITDRKRAQKDLEYSEAKYRQLFQGSRDGFVMVDKKQKIIDANQAYCKMLGYSLEELKKLKNFYEITPKKWHKYEKEEIWERGLLAKGYSGIYEKEYIRKDGTVLPVELQSYCVFDTRGNVLYLWGVARDITETKKLRDMRSRAQRMEAAGTIAGQVAHDFNNLLGPIVAYPEMIRSEIPENNKVSELLDDIENSAKKMADINQDLLTLARRGYYNQKILNLNNIIDDAIIQHKNRTDKIVFKTDKESRLLNIAGGQAQIHRMISNMIGNACDAMNNEGEILIKTENYYPDFDIIAYQHIPRGEYVKVTISDQGKGIPKKIRDKIFDPFFTTKTTEDKRGSGLGMSIVDAVMKDHKGYIDFESEVGKGTSFYLYFPVARQDIKEDLLRHDISGTERLMIVDDDFVQRKVMSMFLKPLGYKITEVGSGEEALRIIKNKPQDLLILDMVMPNGIDGAETYKRALEFNPKQQAIIVSGFSQADKVKLATEMGVGKFIRKPLTQSVVAYAVRSELDRKRIKSF